MIAYGKMNKEKEGSLKEYFDSITTPIFEKVLQEESPNSMTTIEKNISYFFRPNNYRRQIIVKEKTNSTLGEIKPTISHFQWNYNNHTKLISIKNYKPNITIQYGKNTLTAIYSSPLINGNKQTYLIERGSIKEIESRINEIKKDIKERLDNALKEFSRKADIVIPFKKAIWSRHEDFIKGESYIDNIPRECIIHDTIFKKVYGKGIEFIGGKEKEPTVSLKNYIKTRAIEDIAPSIAASINDVGLKFDKFTNQLTPTIADLNVNMKAHLSAVKNIDKSFKRFNKLLSQKRLGEWL